MPLSYRGMGLGLGLELACNWCSIALEKTPSPYISLICKLVPVRNRNYELRKWPIKINHSFQSWGLVEALEDGVRWCYVVRWNMIPENAKIISFNEIISWIPGSAKEPIWKIYVTFISALIKRNTTKNQGIFRKDWLRDVSVVKFSQVVFTTHCSWKRSSNLFPVSPVYFIFHSVEYVFTPTIETINLLYLAF